MKTIFGNAREGEELMDSLEKQWDEIVAGRSLQPGKKGIRAARKNRNKKGTTTPSTTTKSSITGEGDEIAVRDMDHVQRAMAPVIRGRGS